MYVDNVPSVMWHSIAVYNQLILCSMSEISIDRCVFSGREAAVKIGQELYNGHFIHHVTFDHEFKDENLFYRVLGDGHLRALNAKLSYACIPRPGMTPPPSPPTTLLLFIFPPLPSALCIAHSTGSCIYRSPFLVLSY